MPLEVRLINSDVFYARDADIRLKVYDPVYKKERGSDAAVSS